MSRIALLLFVGAILLPAHNASVQSPQKDPATMPSIELGLVKMSAPGTTNPNIVPPGTTIESLADATPEQKARTQEGVAYANKMLSSPEFKKAVIDLNVRVSCFRDNYYHPDFRWSPQAVYDLFVSESPIRLNVVWYDGVGNNEGYEVDVFKNSVGANRVAVERAGASAEHPSNTKEEKEAGFLATLMLHESSHVLGFRHPTTCHFIPHNSDGSVPYQMNHIYWDLADQIGVPQQ